MIPSLRDFDNITAAGILARTALSLNDESNPAAANRLPNEAAIRKAIINDARNLLGIGPYDMSVTALDRLTDVLDDESNSLIEQPNDDEVLEQLADKGSLPSDLFKVNIILNIKDFFGKKYAAEKKLIEETVKSSDKEQHYGPPTTPVDPYLISLFSRKFQNKYPRNSFTMLVIGQRKGIELTVHQAWRIYQDSVSLEGADDLVDMLRRFANKFGAVIDFYGNKGSFFLTADIPNNAPLEYKIVVPTKSKTKGGKHHQITCSHFIQTKPYGTTNQAALVVAIDLDKYRAVLKDHGW